MTPEEAALEAGYAIASDDAAAWADAHDFPAVAKALLLLDLFIYSLLR